ncbi:ATP-binding protein [Flavobacterium sp. NRK1]|uniref:tetratricopeptide repeat-containing sensor histidine kinase n=1 Tax=Flavobacterium sp. NRK1 TaxID=2954929 RepID=UPI002092FDA9|nr:ATP-binding protein [Flavobacterium sp. NRK1]MCO6147031.1 histidine kinase [Flavobacterium sp. NRK1]
MIRQYLLYILTGVFFFCISCKKTTVQNNTPKNRIDSLIELSRDFNLDTIKRRAYTDTIYGEISSSENDSLTRYYFRQAAVSYYNLNLYNKAIKASRKMYKMSVKAKDTLGMAKGLHFLGVSYYGKSDLDSAYYFYGGAEKLYTKFKNTDSRTLGEIVLYKAYIYYHVGEYVLCEDEAFRALKLLRIENNPSDLYNCYNLIASALDGANKNEAAIEYFGMAFDILDEDYKDEGYTDKDIIINKAICYNNMGNAYSKMGKYKKAIEIYNKALEFPETKSWASLYSKLLNSLAAAKYKSGDESQIPELFYKSLKIRDSLGDEQGVIASNVALGEYSLYKKDTVKAINYLRTAYSKAETEKSNYDLLTSLRILLVIDKKDNDFYIKRYMTVNDSLQQIAENTKNKFARIEYDTERIINEKEALAKKNSFIIGVSVVVVLFIAAIFIIYYLNSRNKELLLIQEQQKANEEIYELMFEQQNKIESAKTEEKSRIAMELHDGILNNIYALRLNLEFINKKTDEESIAKRKEYIKELQGVESEIRGVSHDLSKNALFNKEQSFENMLEFMITSQKNNFDTEFEAEIDPEINWENMSNIYKVNIYRIIQETLQNINKYSHATLAKVKIALSGDDISIIIADNGKGFDPEKAKGGIGLKNLKKRTDALNGTLQINSQPGAGVVIQLLFPI